jgi:hypothetical protein
VEADQSRRLALFEMADHRVPDGLFQGLHVFGLGDDAFPQGPGGKTPLGFLGHLENDFFKSVGHGGCS